MSGSGWTPAPKRGIIPLHPMTFGTVLGRSFAALRHNPKVLFGFAILVQVVVIVAAAVAIGITLFASFSRLETVSTSSPDFEPLLAGAVAMNIVVGFLVGLASTAFLALVQGLVAADIGYAAVGEKATLRQLWRRLRPAIWRLFAFAGLTILVAFGLIVLLFGFSIAASAGLVALDPGLAGLAMLFSLLIGIALIPVIIWLSTKLLLVPSVLVLEQARFREAFVRSWRLTRGRFWFAFGVMAVISVIMGAAAQLVSIPASIISGILMALIAPTGDPGPSAIVGILAVVIAPQILVLVLQAVAVVVQCTASTLVYIDCRMRYEGLDQTLLAYLERRDQGVAELVDPFDVDPARAVSSAPPVAMARAPYPPYPAPPGYAPPPGYASAPGSGVPGHAASPYGAPQPYAAQSYPPAPPFAAAPPPYTAQPPAAAPAPADPTLWAAPGSEDR